MRSHILEIGYSEGVIIEIIKSLVNRLLYPRKIDFTINFLKIVAIFVKYQNNNEGLFP